MNRKELIRWSSISVLIALAIFLSSTNVSSQGCLTIEDCLNKDCPGAIRACVNSKCKVTDCVVPNSEQIVIREGEVSFEEAVKPYEEGINLSKKTKNPGGMRQGVLTSLGVEELMPKILQTLGIVFVILFGLILMAMIKSEGNARAALLGFVIIIMAGLIFVILNIGQFSALFSGITSSATIWEKYSTDDFIEKRDAFDFDALIRMNCLKNK